jgi:type III secretion system HrpE/YscL family protein
VGRVVKGEGRVIPAAVLDAQERAAALLASARAEADRVRADALAARDEARRQGREQGHADAAALLVAALAEADHVISAARTGVLAVAGQIAGRMVERIVGRALAVDPQVAADIAGEALGACRPRGGPVCLRVHPEDLPALEPRRAGLLGRLGAGAVLTFAADDRVGRGGCVVETPVGRVDARLETQIAALERALGGGGDP